MKSKILLVSKVLFVTVALMCLIGSIPITAAQVVKIGTGSDPAVYGSKVTWSNTAGSIQIYDLTSRRYTNISSSRASYPAIYGNKIVWHDESGAAPRLIVYDIPSGLRSYISTNVDHYSIPEIYGNRIVWSSNSIVYMRDISTSTQTLITSGDMPDIYNTKITYTHEGEERPNVYVYDVIARTNTLVSDVGDHYNPHIYGNKVIWSDFNTRMGYISMYDLVTRNTIDVTSDNAYSGDPSNPDAGDDTGTHTDINGNRIVYAKTTNDLFGNAGVYVYSISASKSTPVYNYASGVFTTPDVYGNIVAWGIDQPESYSVTHDNGIYVCDLTAKPIASFSANKVNGLHPLTVTFTYKATGGGTPNTYLWNFGDRTTSSHELTATHTYTRAGTYTVSLTVTNGAGSNTMPKTAYIRVL